jgi:MFS family permease
VTTTTSISGTAFRLMLGATVLGFGGYALLLPVVPLWAADGGAGALGAGATTGMLMATTVATQLLVPWLLVRLGYRWVLALGFLLLGAPAPLLALSSHLAPVLAICAVRGVGFGLVTVAGSALVAELAPPAQHGRAAGRYGLAVGLPQLVLMAAGLAVVDRLGFAVVFVAAGVLSLLGLLLVPGIRVPAKRAPEPPAARVPGSLTRSAVPPMVAMLTCSIAQGGLITFLPLAVPDAALLVALALLATSAGGLLGRLAAGELVDRRGWGGRLLAPGMLLAAVGLLVEVAAIGSGGGVLLAVGSAAVGVGFGAVQNDALTALFTAFGRARYGAASAAWNIAFDAGTGVGAVGLGAVAEPFGFGAAFATAAALLCGGVLAVRPERRSGGRGPLRRREADHRT